jgi:hypothetical protein
MKAEQLVITLEEVKMREDEHLINMVMLFVSVISNIITCDTKVIEINEEFKEDIEPIKPKGSKKIFRKAAQAAQANPKFKYHMDIYLSHLDCQTKYTNEKRM